jgi:hypothetical protein
MAEIIKTYKEKLPALRLIGKRYTNEDRDKGGGYGGKWGEWFQNGNEEKLTGYHKESGGEIDGSYLGFMRCDGTDESFEYWIGIFFPAGTDVPESYDFLDLEGGDVGICWIKGNADDGSIYWMHEKCVEEMQKENMKFFEHDEKMYLYSFERYSCPRFTEKDEQGNVILDYGIYVKD